MPPLVKTLAQEYDRLFANTAWVIGTGAGVLILVVAYTINHVAGKHATMLAPIGRSISDVLLDMMPRIDTSLIHEEAHVISILTLTLLFFLPRFFPLVFAGVAALILTRSVFINMTHLGLYEDAVRITGSYTTFGGDLFFSGHVAIPFMLALVFWEIRPARYIFVFFSIIFGAAAIAGHYHYSIDIFAAPFIAYGVYHAVRRIFPSIAELADRPASSA